MADHPTLDQLDLLRDGTAQPEVAEHLAACTECQANLRMLQALADEFTTDAVAAPPPAIEAAIQATIERRSVRRMPRWRQPLAWAAAVAVVIAGVVVTLQAPPAPEPPAVTGDVNGDGILNILDSLALAQRVEAGESMPRHFDFDRDGAVTRQDADALAHRVVQLPGGPG